MKMVTNNTPAPPPPPTTTVSSSSSDAIISELPSEEEGIKALSLFSKKSNVENDLDFTANGNDEQWRDIVFQCLCYGTGTNRNSMLNSTLYDNEDSDMRVDECVHYLLRMLNWYHITSTSSSTSGVNDIVCECSFATPESVITDVLWLMGSLIEPAPESAATINTTTNSISNTSTIHATASSIGKSYESLCKIIRYLSITPPNPSSYKNNSTATSIITIPTTDTTYQNTIPLRLLQTSLEPNLLVSSKLIQSHDLFFKKLRKVNTDMFYRQKKVNLCQEESEGYAKILHFLVALPYSLNSLTISKDEHEHKHNNLTNSCDSASSPTQINYDCQLITSRIQEYIGIFDLDPNRVLDLTLDTLEAQIQQLFTNTTITSTTITATTTTNANTNINESIDEDDWIYQAVRNAPQQSYTITLLLEIIKMFPTENVTHLMGFKFSSYASNSTTESATPGNNTPSTNNQLPLPQKQLINTPKGLYITTAILVSHSLLSLSLLTPHLQPNNTAINTNGNNDTTNTTTSTTKSWTDAILYEYSNWLKDYKSKIQKMGVVSLNASSKDDNTNISMNNSSTKDDEKMNLLSSTNTSNTSDLAATNTKGGIGDSTSTSGVGGEDSEMKSHITATKNMIFTATKLSSLSSQMVEGNQFLILFHTLVQVGVPWNDILSLFTNTTTTHANTDSSSKFISNIINACCSIYPNIHSSLCKYLWHYIEDLYYNKVNDIGQMLVSAANLKSSSTSADTQARAVRTNIYDSLLPSRHLTNDKVSSTATILQFCQELTDILRPIIATGCISMNPILYCKICRLAKVLLEEEKQKYNWNTINNDDNNIDEKSDDASFTEIITSQPVLCFLKEFLVPSLSHFPSNPSISSDLWNVLSTLPYQIRYVLYSSWKEAGLEKTSLRKMTLLNSYITPPLKPLSQIESEVNTGISIRYLLKRMSKDNIRDIGRQVSRVAHNNPLVVFTAILNQIESYDNLILMMVDTFKFMTVLSLDIMGFCLLSSLGGGVDSNTRSKLKADGVNVAQWLSSLETFTGAFYTRFTDCELRGLLSYLTQRLRDGQIIELGVLQTLLKMTGGYGFIDYGSTTSLSQVQLDGLCGSQMLKRETSDFGIVEQFNIKSSRRLRHAIQSRSCGVVYLILLSQLRNRVLFEVSSSSPKQIKLIGNLYDTCQKTIFILLAFLTDFGADENAGSSTEENKSIASYAASLPKLSELHSKYGVETSVAWMLCRPLIREALFAEEDARLSIPSFLVPFHPSSEQMRSHYESMLPAFTWQYVTPTLFETFYSYSLYDLHCPEERYTIEIARLNKEVDRLTQLQKGGKEAVGMQASLAAAAAAAGKTEREIREAQTFTKAHGKDLERAKRHIETLSSDMKRQKHHCESVRKRLEASKTALLSTIEDDRKAFTANHFLTHFIFPRCRLSPEDAMYCARFVILLHQLEIPGFFTLHFMDAFVNSIVGALYSVTEDEAVYLGILLEELWKNISKWRYDENCYLEEVAGKPGSTCYTIKKTDTDEKDESFELLSHEDFVTLYDKWHSILGLTFIGCLQSSEYMHNRTALILLTGLVREFPTKSKLGEKLIEALSPLQGEDNKMQDIKNMALAYNSQILKARDDGVWKEEDKEELEARLEKGRQIQEERKKNLEKQLEMMKNESEQITREIGDSRGRNWRGSNVRDGPRDNRGSGGPAGWKPLPQQGGATNPSISNRPSVPSSDTRGGDSWNSNTRNMGPGSSGGGSDVRRGQVDRDMNSPNLRGSRNNEHSTQQLQSSSNATSNSGVPSKDRGAVKSLRGRWEGNTSSNNNNTSGSGVGGANNTSNIHSNADDGGSRDRDRGGGNIKRSRESSERTSLERDNKRMKTQNSESPPPTVSRGRQGGNIRRSSRR